MLSTFSHAFSPSPNPQIPKTPTTSLSLITMEPNGTLTVEPKKKTTISPKAILHQKFGTKACYKVEQVEQQSNQNACPGLAFSQNGPILFRCALQLPDFTVVSKICTKKKDAEQSAAEIALKKLGINNAMHEPVIQDPWDELTSRISYFFSNEFLLSLHPLSGHFRETLRREDGFIGRIPASVLAAYDPKLINLCKFINPEVESNPCLSLSIIVKAASRLSGTISMSESQLWMWRQTPYSSEVVQSIHDEQLSVLASICVECVRVPAELSQNVEQLTLNVSSFENYLDAIAQKLELLDASNVLVSGTIGKASSETRLYFAAPDLDLSCDNGKDAFDGNKSINARASYLCGQNIYGDAIMASIGYTRKYRDLFYEKMSMRSYFRMFLNKIPNGIYKLSREAILTAGLPAVFTTKGNWRGSFPRDLLCMFCRQHRLSEPIFSVTSIPLKATSKLSKSSQESDAEADPVKGDTFKCDIKISKGQELLIKCSPEKSYKKQIDAIQNASLNIILWLNAYFQEIEMPLENLTSSGDVLDIKCDPQNFVKVFESWLLIHGVCQGSWTQSVNEQGCEIRSLEIEGPASGFCPSSGSMACLSYAVSLVIEGEEMEVLEKCAEFEFEIGIGAVIPHVETVVTQLNIDQTAFFSMGVPHQELILAAAGATANTLSLLSSEACLLKYSLTLLRVTEPLEARMEQAFFKPPLSKQRVEFGLQQIKESGATTLIDFGCGSGSLLDSLLDYPTSLGNIVGVDISHKGLCHAAKALHLKLSRISDPTVPSTCIKSALLYEGSITAFDYRICGFDIGTCLEVIEHMEEDQACSFGDMALGYFRPRILVVSTPNYEYNVLLQRSNVPNQDEDPDVNSQSQACKFRNHDHKFEWTRKQFNQWASDLAARHNYSVEFSGVGGSDGLEPGFASQIAVFKKGPETPRRDDYLKNVESCMPYQVIWEWNSTTSKGSPN